MLEYKFTYSESQFPNASNINTGILIDTINANEGITPNCIRIDSSGTNYYIIFSANLSAQEKTTLDGIISAHNVITSTVYINSIPMPLILTKSNTNQFRRMATAIYEGAYSVGSIKKLVLIAKMDGSMDSYTIQLYDYTNDNIMCEMDFNNTIEQIITLEPIINVPTGEALIELNLRRNGGTALSLCYVDSAVMHMS